MALATFWAVVALTALALIVPVTYIVHKVDMDGVMQTVVEAMMDSTPFVCRAIVCFLIATGIVSTVWPLFI